MKPFLFILLAVAVTVTYRNAHAAAVRTYDIVVAQDGSGTFTTLKDAVASCPDYSVEEIVIIIKNGVYQEKLVIPAAKSNITFVGESTDGVIVTFSDYSGKLDSAGVKFTTFTSYTCLVAASNITFERITFVNAAGPVGQAVAVHVEGDRCVFRNCRLIGNQDTLFAAGENSRQYFADCWIEGTTDFIFGPSTAVFNRCTIKSKKNSYVTAASTPQTREFGFVFLDCALIAADTGATKVHLGRPWRPYAMTAFVRCTLGAHIVPAGWHNWNKPESERTARYWEYASTGPGAQPSARVPWSRQLSKDEAGRLTPAIILRGSDNWDPSA